MTREFRDAFGLEDRVGVVTGAGGGIGRASVAVLDHNLAGAHAALFLASPRSSVNGAELMIDGGLNHDFMGMIPRSS